MLGGGQLELVFKQVGETLKESIREISLEITWPDGKFTEEVSFVQYVVTSGRLSPLSNIRLPAPAPGQPPAPGQRNLNTLLPKVPSNVNLNIGGGGVLPSGGGGSKGRP